MVTVGRWRRAQAYERSYWEAQAQAIAAGTISQLDWYRWRADQLVSRLRALGLTNLTMGGARVLEVGCGPIGVAAFFPAIERVAIDPLESFYALDPVLTQLRAPTVQYLEGAGEHLPCPGERYDLAIVENCIDHVRDVQAVRGELLRVLQPDGILYLTVNFRTPWGFLVHRVLSRLNIDRGHPHTFTARRARRLLDGRGFRILSFEAGSTAEARLGDLRSPELRARLKGLLGVSEATASVIAQRVTDARRAAPVAVA